MTDDLPTTIEDDKPPELEAAQQAIVDLVDNEGLTLERRYGAVRYLIRYAQWGLRNVLDDADIEEVNRIDPLGAWS